VEQAKSFIKAFRWSDALTACEGAIEIAPDDCVRANVLRAVVLLFLGRLDEALAAADRTIELEPDYALPHNIRSEVLTKLREFGESNKPGYTGEHGENMGDEANTEDELVTLARKIPSEKRGAAIDLLKNLVEGARETTGRAPAKPRPPETAPVAEREPPRPAQQRTAQELFGKSASTPARRYHKSDGPEFCEAELADRVLLAAAEATRNEMKTRAKTEVLTTEERARWQRAGRFVYHARK
jgi:hypothetical protein